MEIIELLSIILPALASLGVFLIIIINLYKKIRRKFPAKVNCWFCNEWAKVNYDCQNSWTCPKCEQYNGFTQDGDYNKTIPEQHDEFLNTNVSTKSKKVIDNDNGLCNVCNNNQRLKIHQLAVFSPIDDANFDEEIERYEQQLERAYPLCATCEKVVKKTLRKQKSLLLGLNLSSSKNGLSFFNTSYELKTAKKLFIQNLIHILITILAIIEIINTAKNLNYYQDFKKTETFKNIFGIFGTFFEILNYLLNLGGNHFLFTHFKNFDFYQNFIKMSLESVGQYISAPLVGLLLETTLIFSQKTSKIKFLTVFLWGFTLFSSNSSVEMVKFINIASSLALIFIKRIKKLSKSEKLDFSNSLTFTSTPEKSYDKPFYEKTDKNLFKMKDNPHLNINPPLNSLNFNSLNENLSLKNPIFGQKPIFENPLHTKIYRNVFNDSFSDKNSIFNSSLNSIFNETLNSNEELTLELSINDKLNELHLGTYQKLQNYNDIPKAFKITKICRPKPVLSPPKLGNLTQSSWLAGGYWKSDFSNLSRSSSQSSGFGSQTSTQNLEAFNSLPPSRNTSICGEIDRFSVFSEPVRRPLALDHFQRNAMGHEKSSWGPMERCHQALYAPKSSGGHEHFQRISSGPDNSQKSSMAPSERSNQALFGSKSFMGLPVADSAGPEAFQKSSTTLNQGLFFPKSSTGLLALDNTSPEVLIPPNDGCRPPRGSANHANCETNSLAPSNNYFLPINPQNNYNTNLIDYKISNLNITKPILSNKSDIWPSSDILRPPSVCSQNFSTNCSVRSYATSKIYNKNNGYVRGSLLQKWREQNGFDEK